MPDNMVGEIIHGSLVTHPRPGPRHARAASVLGSKILNSFDITSIGDDDGWWIVFEPEIHLSDDVVVPDIAGWRKSTMSELPETAFFSSAPDWTCEVLSPSTAKYDRNAKRDIYARVGVGHYWIVDPVVKMIEVFALENGTWRLAAVVADEETAALPPFHAVPFDLGTLWR